MNDRFESLYKLENNLYIKDSPIIISAGALLKDTKTDSVIAQLKFQSITNKKIIALKITINAFDISGNFITGVEDYQYLDLNAKNGDFFGNNKAILMPDNVTRSIKIEKLTIVFEKGEQVVMGKELHSLPKQEKLSQFLSSDLIEQYQIDVSATGEYVPKYVDSLWLCSCGAPNATNICVKCCASQEVIFKSYNPTALSEHFQRRLTQQKELAEEKHRKELEEQSKRKKKIATLIAVGMAIVLLLIAVFIINSIKERKAYNALLSEIDSYIEMECYEEAFDMVCTSDITFDDYLEYREKLIPLMKSNFNNIKNSSKENLAFCLGDVEYYVDSKEIYLLKDSEKIVLYEVPESLELLDTYYSYSLSYKRTIYANGTIYFVERCKMFDSETLDEDYVFYLKSLNLTTGNIETISSESGYANIYCMLKLENGSIYVAFDFWDENDGVIYNPYSQSKYEGQNIIEESRIESAIYGYIW